MEIKKIDLDDADKPVSPVKPISRLVTERSSPTEQSSSGIASKIPSIILFVLVIVAGVFSGAWLKTNQKSVSSSGSTKNIQANIPESGAKVGDVYGSADEKSFKDSTTGVVDKGGMNGEGTHKLLRAGGATKTACLSSSTIDLDLLVGHQVTIWGETFKGQKCGWLMDVGRAKVEALNAPLPQ